MLLLVVVAVSGVYAQPGDENKDEPKTSSFKLTLNGHTKQQSKEMREVLVVLYQDPTKTGRWVEVQKTVSSRKGEFKFEIDLFSSYMVEVAKDGFTTKQVTFDTDVYEEGNKKHEFEFEVDMVPDDGIKYTGPVANVFFHTKKHEFDYELDYSKDEQDEWERLERERLEKEEQMRIEAELAAERMMEAEEAKTTEAQIMAAKIEEKVKLGMGDKERTIQHLAELYPKEDTLRQKKAEAMYAQLIAEREAAKAGSRPVDYKSLFGAAQRVEKEAEEEHERMVEEEKRKAREEQEAIEAKKQEVLEKQKKVAAMEMEQRLAAAEKEAEQKERKEFEDKVEAFQAAIDRGGGDKKATIAAIKKTFPKDEAYADEKAEALYEEYQKLRQGGQTKASINYKSLFATAERAEMAARKKEEEDRKQAGEDKYDALVQKLEAKKAEQEAEALKKIEDAIQANSGNKEKLIQAFEKVLPPGEKFKREQAEAMYAQYEKQRTSGGAAPGNTQFTKEQIIDKLEDKLPAGVPNKKASAEELYKTYTANKDIIAINANDRGKAVQAVMRSIPADDPYREEKAKAMVDLYQEERELARGGNAQASVNYKSIFSAAKKAKDDAIEDARDKKEAEEVERQKRIAEHFEEKRKSLENNAEEGDKSVVTAHSSEKNKAILKRNRAVKDAFEQGGGDPDKTIQLLMKTFPSDVPYKEEKATAMYEQNEEDKKLALNGNSSFAIDYNSLFAAADRAELNLLKQENEEKVAKIKAEQEERRKELQQQREEILAAENQKATEELAKATEELAIAEANYKTPEQLAQEEKERKLALAQRELNQSKFNELIADANTKKKQQKYEEAKDLYKQASELDIDKNFVEENIREMDRLIAAAEKEKVDAELAAAEEAMRLELEKAEAEMKKLLEEQEKEAQIQKEYTKLMKNGKEQFDFRKYEDARETFAKAAELRPDSKEATDMMNKAKQLAVEEKKAAEDAQIAADKKKRDGEKYDKLMAEANVAFENSYLQEAKQLYTEAAELMPELTEAKEKLKETEERIADKRKKDEEAEKLAAAQKAKEEKYNKLTDAGDDLFDKGDYTGAKAKYQEAGSVWADGKYHLVRIRDVDNRLTDIAKLDAEYADYMEQAKSAFNSKLYEKSRGLYAKASQLKSDEQEPKDKIKEIRDIEAEIAAAAAEEERRRKEAIREAREKNYKMFMESGDESLAAEDYAKAVEWYENAIDTKPNEQEAKDKKAKAEGLWEEQIKRDAELAKAMSEAERREKMETLLRELEQKQLDEQKKREEFLSQVARIYPQGLTEEHIEEKNYDLHRFVYNDNGEVTIYEQKVWDWGGKFHFKNGDITITEELFNLGVSGFKK